MVKWRLIFDRLSILSYNKIVVDKPFKMLSKDFLLVSEDKPKDGLRPDKMMNSHVQRKREIRTKDI
jgi:hypothetical protein